MRRLSAILIIVIMIPSLFLSTSASTNEKFPFEQHTVKVGITPFPHFSEFNADGSYSGIIVDYLNEMKKYTGWQIEYIETDPTESINMLKNGKIDIMGGMIKSPETMKIYDLAELSSGYAYSTITVKKTRTDFIPNDYETFSGIKIAIYKKAISRITAFERFCDENKLKFTPVYFDDPKKWEEAFQTGAVDAKLTNSAKLQSDEKIIADFQLEPYYFGVTKGKTSILNEINASLELIRQINPNFDVNLYRKHFGETHFGELHLTANQKEFVAKYPVLRVAIVSDWKPISYYDKSGNPKGISPDILQIISDKTGFKLEYVTTNNFKQSLDFLKTNKVDLLVGVPNEGLPNEKSLIYSLPLFPMQMVMINKNNVDIKSLKSPIMAVGYGFNYDALVNAVKREYGNANDAIVAVKQGKADFTIVNNFVSDNYITNHGKSGLSLITMANLDVKLSIAINSPSNPTLMTIIDKAINSIDNMQMQSIIFKNTSQNDNITFAHLMYSNPTQTISMVAAIGIFAIITLIVVTNMRLHISKKNFLISDTYRIIGELSDEYIFVYDFETKKISLPKSAAKLFGVQQIMSREECNKKELINLIDLFNLNMSKADFSDECSCTLADGTQETYRALCAIIHDKNNKPVRGIGKLVSIQAELDEKREMEKLLNTDALTGLHSKHYCEELATNNNPVNIALMLIDIDNFKNANDTLGHLGGDELLKYFAEILKSVFVDGEILARWGGDEFIVIINENCDRCVIEEKANKLCNKANCQFNYDGQNFQMSISMGIAFSNGRSDVRETFTAADESLYVVKRTSKNGYKFAN